tara:strand:- start:30 stop:227 length:198 start_codon:yes stop_codon:yes gene_type:complete
LYELFIIVLRSSIPQVLKQLERSEVGVTFNSIFRYLTVSPPKTAGGGVKMFDTEKLLENAFQNCL